MDSYLFTSTTQALFTTRVHGEEDTLYIRLTRLFHRDKLILLYCNHAHFYRDVLQSLKHLGNLAKTKSASCSPSLLFLCAMNINATKEQSRKRSSRDRPMELPLLLKLMPVFRNALHFLPTTIFEGHRVDWRGFQECFSS